MSILKLVRNKKGNPIETLHDRIVYVMRSNVAQMGYIYGANVSTTSTFDEMLFLKQCYGQEHGKAYYHCVICPEQAESINADDFFTACVGIAEEFAHFGGLLQVLMALHFEDSVQIHSHFIINNIDILSGRRWDINKQTLRELKDIASHILLSYGVTEIRKYIKQVKPD